MLDTTLNVSHKSWPEINPFISVLVQFGGFQVQFQVHVRGSPKAETHPRIHEGEGAAAWAGSW